MVGGRRLLALAALATLFVAACGDGAGTAPGASIESPSAGVLAVRLDAANDDAGAVLLSVTGGTVDSVVAACDCQLDYDRGDTTRIMVAGPLAGGTEILRVYVPGGQDVTTYRAAVEQVANRASFARMDASAYVATPAATP